MNEHDDPWKGLSPPDQMTRVSGRRVDPRLKWEMYWAVDTDGSCLLILRHARENRPGSRLPKLRGLEIETRIPSDENQSILVIRLKDTEQRDIFHRLCLDIISATRLAESEEEAIERFLARTWRWHRLLRGGRIDKLTDEEQKGLIGELRLMQQHLFRMIGVAASIRSWTGPLDSPKDFEIGRVCVEVKARRGAARPFVTISTEHQLDTMGLDALFLFVLEVTGTSSDDHRGVTVSDAARGVLAELQNLDVSVVELFEERLLATGFDWQDDYTGSRWLVGSEHIFEVVDGFPRITPGMYSTGVTNVRYAIALQDCEAFRSDQANLASVLLEGRAEA